MERTICPETGMTAGVDQGISRGNNHKNKEGMKVRQSHRLLFEETHIE